MSSQSTGSAGAGSMNVNEIQNTAMNVVEGVCKIVTMPVEMIIRPRYGTRYCPAPILFLSMMLMIFLPVMSAVTTSIVSMIPFTHVRGPVGLFSIASMSKLFFLLAFVHNIRLWRLMTHMEKENISEFEGGPLPFLYIIPGATKFWVARIVIEPVALFIFAGAMQRILIFQPGLANYLQLAALMLAMKGYIAWYRCWEFLRIAMDARNAGPIIAKLVEGKATDKELASIHVARLPENVAPEVRSETIAHIARAFSPTNR